MTPNPAAYHVLLVDDSSDTRSGIQLEFSVDDDFVVDVASSANEAKQMLREQVYDVLVFDIFLGSNPKGNELALQLRKQGFQQPIIIATGKDTELDRPIRDYEELFRHGPTFFYMKRSEPLGDIIREAAETSDILLRTLRLFKRNQVDVGGIQLGNNTYRLDDLLWRSDEEGDQDQLEEARKQLREGLATLLVTSLERGGYVNRDS